MARVPRANQTQTSSKGSYSSSLHGTTQGVKQEGRGKSKQQSLAQEKRNDKYARWKVLYILMSMI